MTRIPGRQRACRITLACGCTTFSRTTPLNPRARYGCTSGLGHGYKLAWLTWTDPHTGITRTNKETP